MYYVRIFNNTNLEKKEVLNETYVLWDLSNYVKEVLHETYVLRDLSNLFKASTVEVVYGRAACCFVPPIFLS